MTGGRVRSFLQHTSSPTRPNEATSDADELSKICDRLQNETRLPNSDIKLENVIVETSHAREIPAKMMSIEEAKAIQNKHHHPKPLLLQPTFLAKLLSYKLWYSSTNCHQFSPCNSKNSGSTEELRTGAIGKSSLFDSIVIKRRYGNRCRHGEIERYRGIEGT